MTAVSVLTAARINRRRVDRRLARAGYTAVAQDDGVRVSRADSGDAVTVSTAELADLPAPSLDAARRLLGLFPSSGVTCRFDGAIGESDAWVTVVDIARAVAAEVPLAVLDDHAGTTYLIHAGRGLVPPEEYEPLPGTNRSTDFLRRLLGN
jgi:hypothetical protein